MNEPGRTSRRLEISGVAERAFRQRIILRPAVVRPGRSRPGCTRTAREKTNLSRRAGDWLVARHEPARRSRFAVRWLERLLEEDERLSIEEAAVVAASSIARSAAGGTERR
jgi:hypothetical protein